MIPDVYCVITICGVFDHGCYSNDSFGDAGLRHQCPAELCFGAARNSPPHFVPWRTWKANKHLFLSGSKEVLSVGSAAADRPSPVLFLLVTFFLWLPLVVKVLERTKNISPADAPYNDCDFTMVNMRRKRYCVFCFSLVTTLLSAVEGQLLFQDDLKNHLPVSSSPIMLRQIGENPNCRAEAFEKRSYPRGWWLDFRTMSRDGDFSCTADGFRIDSPHGFFKFYGPTRQVLDHAWTVEAEFTRLSGDTEVKFGIYDSGLIRNRTDVFREYPAGTPPGRVKCSFRISCLDGYDICAPMFAVKGHAVIHNLRILREPVPGCTVVEGEIKARSELPSPGRSDYPDCRYTAHFAGNAIHRGKAIPKELSLTIEGFRKNKLLPSSGLKAGNKILCVLLPFSDLPGERQSTQSADDLNLFALENYYVLAVHKIPEFTESQYDPKSGIFFLDAPDEYVSIFSRRINPGSDPAAAEQRKAQMRADLTEIERRLAGWSDDRKRKTNRKFVAAWNAEKRKDADGRNRVTVAVSTFVWRKMGNAFFQLHQAFDNLFPTGRIPQENIDALVRLRDALAANGVDLMISLVPDRNQVSARIMNGEFKNVPDCHFLDTCRQLLKNGIETVFPFDELISGFDKEEFAFSLYGDPHPSLLVQKTAARKLAKRLSRYDIGKNLRGRKFGFRTVPANHFAWKPLWPANCDIGGHTPGTPVTVKQLLLDNAPVRADRTSAILVVGDSFSQTPYTDGNAISSYLASAAESSVDFYQFSGNGPETFFISQLLHDPVKFLKNKKVLIIHTGLFAFHDHRWRNIGHMDDSLKKLSSSRHVATFELKTTAGDLKKVDPGTLDRRKRILSGTDYVLENGRIRIAEIPLDRSLAGKKLLCVIPVSVLKGEVTLVVNGETVKVPHGYAYGTPSYQNLVFPLPGDSAKLTIDACGTANSFFIVNKIELREIKR